MPTTSTPRDLDQLGRTKSVAARVLRERLIVGTLAIAACFSILVTSTIIAVLAQETWGFFQFPNVTLGDFFGGTEWNPLLGAEKHFGIWPLVSGTLLVTVIAATFALPIGLVCAIYLSEYSSTRVRATLKPALEILAGVPTVVYGFFALTIITPVLQKVSPAFGSYNAMAAGLATGIMILPIVCSMSEDSLRAVPRSLRDGALALGGTKFDVSVKVVVPAALSGIVAAFLLAISRAIGETMIVALAAGGIAQITANPTAEVQTMTAYMVQIFLGDAPAVGVEYKSSYAVASVLFVMTFAITMIGQYILRRFREEYD
ncbi:MAG: phosphate ABC transporter permease subunit PstC [Planctomycetota bacterium]|nr:MAG: phosphate ABC transporter permease subunit PstC [Planctomycetota bacterium]